MPALLFLILGIAVFSLTLRHGEGDAARTGLEGFRIYLIPDFSGMTLGRFFTVLMDAMGQLFYSISVAMGIMITYGSYVKKETNLVKSVNQIEIFDTIIAFLVGLMIILAVFSFIGVWVLASDTCLMFPALNELFSAMGAGCKIVGVVFFFTVN